MNIAHGTGVLIFLATTSWAFWYAYRLALTDDPFAATRILLIGMLMGGAIWAGLVGYAARHY
jgi:hypothetical protein